MPQDSNFRSQSLKYRRRVLHCHHLRNVVSFERQQRRLRWDEKRWRRAMECAIRIFYSRALAIFRNMMIFINFQCVAFTLALTNTHTDTQQLNVAFVFIPNWNHGTQKFSCKNEIFMYTFNFQYSIITFKIRCTFKSMYQYYHGFKILVDLTKICVHLDGCNPIWQLHDSIQSTKSTDKKMHSDINLFNSSISIAFYAVVISFEKIVTESKIEMKRETERL